MPDRFFSESIAVSEDHVFVFGGSNTFTARVEDQIPAFGYDVTANRWSRLETTP